MSDGYSVARLQDIAPVEGLEPGEPTWRAVRQHFGIHAFGVNAWTAEAADQEIIEPHDEAGDPPHGGHEELYFVATGHARFTVDGEEVDAPAGTFVFVGDPGVQRQAIATEAGTTILTVGAAPGVPFKVSPWELRYHER
jgi:mannose-6-phosphate isomerase-like protein (cupin superfamily)